MPIPVERQNGRVFVSWWNDIRDYLIEIFGGGAIGETSVELGNGEGSPLDVTGLSFDGSLYRFAEVNYSIHRKTDTASSEVVAIGTMRLSWSEESSEWSMSEERSENKDTGITFSVTTGGQVQYTSTTIAGDNYEGTVRFRATTFDF